jgi:hypothetical protein
MFVELSFLPRMYFRHMHYKSSKDCKAVSCAGAKPSEEPSGSL